MGIEIGNDGVQRILDEVDNSNKRLDESNTRSLHNDISSANKDFIKRKFYGQKIFSVNGFKKEKFNWYGFWVNLRRSYRVAEFVYEIYCKIRRFFK